MSSQEQPEKEEAKEEEKISHKAFEVVITDPEKGPDRTREDLDNFLIRAEEITGGELPQNILDLVADIKASLTNGDIIEAQKDIDAFVAKVPEAIRKVQETQKEKAKSSEERVAEITDDIQKLKTELEPYIEKAIDEDTITQAAEVEKHLNEAREFATKGDVPNASESLRRAEESYEALKNLSRGSAEKELYETEYNFKGKHFSFESTPNELAVAVGKALEKLDATLDGTEQQTEHTEQIRGTLQEEAEKLQTYVQNMRNDERRKLELTDDEERAVVSMVQTINDLAEDVLNPTEREPTEAEEKEITITPEMKEIIGSAVRRVEELVKRVHEQEKAKKILRELAPKLEELSAFEERDSLSEEEGQRMYQLTEDVERITQSLEYLKREKEQPKASTSNIRFEEMKAPPKYHGDPRAPLVERIISKTPKEKNYSSEEAAEQMRTHYEDEKSEGSGAERRESAPTIADAKSWDELYRAFETTHGIPKGFIDFPEGMPNRSGQLGAEGLKWLVDKVRTGEKNIGSVPTTYGIREKVAELQESDPSSPHDEAKEPLLLPGLRSSRMIELANERLEQLANIAKGSSNAEARNEIVDLMRRSEKVKTILNAQPPDKPLEEKDLFLVRQWIETFDALRNQIPQTLPEPDEVTQSSNQTEKARAQDTLFNKVGQENAAEFVENIFGEKPLFGKRTPGAKTVEWENVKGKTAERFISNPLEYVKEKLPRKELKKQEHLRTTLINLKRATGTAPDSNETVELFLLRAATEQAKQLRKSF